MSDAVILAPESIAAICDEMERRMGRAPQHPQRPELSLAESMQLTGHRSPSAFFP